MNYAVVQKGDVIVLDLIGRISMIEDAFGPVRPELHKLVREQVNAGHSKILLNLRSVTLIDSTGIGELVSSLSTVRRHSGQLRICNGNTRISDLLRITRLDSVLNADTDESTALQAFSGNAAQNS
jgi:anti-sigma B factor antagonist